VPKLVAGVWEYAEPSHRKSYGADRVWSLQQGPHALTDANPLKWGMGDGVP